MENTRFPKITNESEIGEAIVEMNEFLEKAARIALRRKENNRDQYTLSREAKTIYENRQIAKNEDNSMEVKRLNKEFRKSC